MAVVILTELLERIARSSNLPIAGVTIGNELDRSTWRYDYAPNATDQDRAAGDALIAGFDPESPTVIAIAQVAEAQAALTTGSRAFWLFWFRKTYNREPTAQDRATDVADLIQAFKDES